MRGRITKAKRYFVPGARPALLQPDPVFYGTIHRKKADPSSVVTDIWPEAWVLPFSMRPLGDPRRQVHKDDALKRWSMLVERLRDYNSVTATMNITGTTVFVPTNVPEQAWQMILKDLAIEPDYGSPFPEF